MYKDIISYKLAENISEEHLLSVARDIVLNWMSKQLGFIKWELHKDSDEAGYTDVVDWESEDDAKKAEADMVNIPSANAWYACYEKDSISGKHLNQIAVLN